MAALILRADGCIEDEVLALYVERRLDGDSRRVVDEHVARCASCRELLSGLAHAAPPGPDADTGAATLPVFDAGSDAELAPGAIVGRFVVLTQLGQGGMGVVYAAHDPELNRKVALKVLRGGAHDPAAREALGERLRREAQAMAQLADPHVVAVHDVGSVGDRLFVAMELVEGETLGAWLAAKPRPWREILARFVPAGLGLAAAHEAGLVHRDFKPDNVLLGKDGRVRVGDFGLARPLVEADALPARPSAGATTADVTATGSLVGTPFYMAPEQFLGRTVDARSDQFSFCVTLYHALVGAHPYAGERFEELAHAVTHGQLRATPRPDPLPAWLRRVLLRGLAVDPADRYPSMKALLAALDRRPRRRALVAAALLVPLVAIAGSAIIARRAAPPPPCADDASAWVGTWDAPRAAAVDVAFARTALPYAGTASAMVRRDLDAYTRAWSRGRHEACVATRVRGVQSEALLDKRMLCLEARRREVRALSDAFVAADASLVESAGRKLGALPDLRGCADLQALSAQVAPPADPATRARVEALFGRLAAIKVAGQKPDPARLAAAQAIVDDAHATGYLPLEAEALHVLAAFWSYTGDFKKARGFLDQAVWAAEASRSDERAARSWIGIMNLTAAEGRDEEALAFTPRVTALLTRMGGNDDIEANLHLERSHLLNKLTRYPEARAEADRSYALYLRQYGPDDLYVAKALENLGECAIVVRQSDEAIDFTRRALAIKQKLLGADHPDVSRLHANLGMSYHGAFRYADAEAEYQLALHGYERTLPPDHPDLANLLYQMGVNDDFLGEKERALARRQRALAMALAHDGKTSPAYATYAYGVGAALYYLHRYGEAEPLLLEALAIQEQLFGPEHGQVGDSAQMLGKVYQELRRLDQALALYQRALRIRETIYGAGSAELRPILLDIGELEEDRGRAAQALAPLERAFALPPDDPGRMAENAFILGVSLVEAHKDRARGMALVAEARAYFVKDPGSADMLATLDGWLAEQQGRRP